MFESSPIVFYASFVRNYVYITVTCTCNIKAFFSKFYNEWMNEWFIFFVANFILKIRWTYIIFRFWHCLSNNENTFLLFDYSNKYSFYHLFIFSRCSRYHQIRLSEKWPSPERRSPREKLAGPNCRRNMYAYSILLKMIKYYFMYYINITNKNSILSLVIQAVMKLWTLQRKTSLSQWVTSISFFFSNDCYLQNHQRQHLTVYD